MVTTNAGLWCGDLVPFRYPQFGDVIRLSWALFVLIIQCVALCAVPHVKVAWISTHLHDVFAWALLLFVWFHRIMRRQLLGCLDIFWFDAYRGWLGPGWMVLLLVLYGQVFSSSRLYRSRRRWCSWLVILGTHLCDTNPNQGGKACTTRLVEGLELESYEWYVVS